MGTPNYRAGGETCGEHTQGREEAEGSTGTEPKEADANLRGLPGPLSCAEAHLLQQQPPVRGELGREDRSVEPGESMHTRTANLLLSSFLFGIFFLSQLLSTELPRSMTQL